MAKKSDAGCVDKLAAVVPRELAEAIVAHRDKLSKPMTVYAAGLLAKRLAECPDPAAAGDMMIEKGWQSISPEWVGNANGQRRLTGPSQPTFNDLASFYDAQSEREGRDSEGTGSLFPDVPKLTHH